MGLFTAVAAPFIEKGVGKLAKRMGKKRGGGGGGGAGGGGDTNPAGGPSGDPSPAGGTDDVSSDSGDPIARHAKQRGGGLASTILGEVVRNKTRSSKSRDY